MSFQYIAYCYTTAPSEGGGQDVTVCSTGLAEDMLPWLETISRHKAAEHAGILGPQYAYRLHLSQGRKYHVLSCVRSIKDEKTQAKGHMAHHFILTPEEVAELIGRPAAPTPAGMMLAFEKCEIWQTGTPGEHPDVDKEPKLTDADLPDDSAQVTWRKFTGRDDYARALLTPPYDKECLIMVPAPVDVRDVLMLLSESDWLTPGRGWGRTFTTHGTVQDDIKETERVSIPICSRLPIEAGWNKVPCLCVNERLDLDKGGDEIPYGAERTTTQGKKRIHPANPVPYHYVEVPDAQMFNVPFRRISPLLRKGGGLLCLCILAACIYMLTGTPEEPGKPVATPVQDLTPKGKRQSGKPKTRIKKCMAVYHGHPVPEELPKLLSGVGADITLQQPGPKGRRIKGTVRSTEPLPGGVLLHVSDKNGTLHHAEVTWHEGFFNTVRVDGVQMALHLTSDKCEIVLVPMIRLVFPPNGRLPLPDIQFDIQPEDLQLVDGRLYCSRAPELEKPIPVVWEKAPCIDIPFFPGPAHAITCHAEPDVPYQINFAPMLPETGSRRLSIELVRPNPYLQLFEKDFDIQANTPIYPNNKDSTPAHLYELAERMKEGGFPLHLKSEYEELRAVLRRHLHLPNYEENGECAMEIESALCEKLNRDIQNCYERLQEGDKTLRSPIVLELHSVYFIDNGTGIHWMFVLYIDDTIDTDLQQPK